MVVASCSVAWPHRIRSSAKSRECMGGQPGPSDTPVRLALDSSCCRVIESSLIATTNR